MSKFKWGRKRESVRNLMKFENIRNWWRLKSANLLKWLIIYNILAKFSKIIGLNMYGDIKDFSYNYYGMVGGGTYTTMMFYTLWYYYNEGDLLKGMQSTCYIGLLITMNTLYYQILGSKKIRYTFNNGINFGGKYVYIENNNSPKYETMCGKMFGKLVQDIAIKSFLVAIVCGTVGLSTIYEIVVHHSRTTFLSLELPFLDKDSDVVYASNLMIQLLIAIYSALTITVNEGSVCLIMNSVIAVPEILKLDGDDLDKELNLNGMSSTAEYRMRNMVLKIMDFYKFMLQTSDAYYLRLFEGPFLYIYSICFAIFSQLVYGYPSGYVMALGNYILLMICCDLGEKLKQTNERLAFEIYSTKWYLLSRTCQNQVRSTMLLLQNLATLTIGPFGPLNFETATDLTKQIYRFTMMLIRVFK